jgi:phosphatidylglycerol:prolipoprotein diacylglycerol transferase
MYPELFTIPGTSITIKTYGFCLMVGFLSAVWFGLRRAARVKGDPDLLLNLSFVALIFGIGGARVFYVIHYWQSQFAGRESLVDKVFAILDIRAGGLEFIGGFLGAMLACVAYMRLRKVSIRMYVDIIAPSVMWGLAFGRIGCFFNGCCFGGPCVADHTHETGQEHSHQLVARAAAAEEGLPWALRFPYGSPPQHRQWENRQVTVPAELIVSNPRMLTARLLRAELLSMSPEKREGPLRDHEDARQRLEEAQARGAGEEELAALSKQADLTRQIAEQHVKQHHLLFLRSAMSYPSREHPERETSVSELQELAARTKSLPVHPAQLYASIHAFLLSLLLSAVFYVRKRHGVVFGLMLTLYPIARFLLESIRTDNPVDTAGFTISQFLSILLFFAGLATLAVVYFALPERSPRAIAYIPPEEDNAKSKAETAEGA